MVIIKNTILSGAWLQSMGSERVGQDLATTQQQNIDIDGLSIFIILPNNLIIGLI